MPLVEMLIEYRKNKSAEMATKICEYLLSLYAFDLDDAHELFGEDE